MCMDVLGEAETPEGRVCTAELGVPGLHSTAPLYHKLQQYRDLTGSGRKGEEGEVTAVIKREVVCGTGDSERDMEEDPLHSLPCRSSSPAIASSVESESLKVRQSLHTQHAILSLFM